MTDKNQTLKAQVKNFNQEIFGEELNISTTILTQFAQLKESLKLSDKLQISLDKSIKGMMQAESREIFLAHQKVLTELILALKTKFALEESQKQILSVIEQNSGNLKTLRFIYLIESNNKLQLLKDSLWIMLGVCLFIAGSVLGFGFPALFIPCLVMGSLSLCHGLLDFVGITMAIMDKLGFVELGERDFSRPTLQKINSLHASSLFNFQKFGGKWSNEKKWLEGLGYTFVFIGLSLAITGLVFTFPLGIPIIAPIVITTVGVIVTLCALALWGFKLYREQQRLTQVREETTRQIEANSQLLSSFSLGPVITPQEGLESYKQNIKLKDYQSPIKAEIRSWNETRDNNDIELATQAAFEQPQRFVSTK